MRQHHKEMHQREEKKKAEIRPKQGLASVSRKKDAHRGDFREFGEEMGYESSYRLERLYQENIIKPVLRYINFGRKRRWQVKEKNYF